MKPVIQWFCILFVFVLIGVVYHHSKDFIKEGFTQHPQLGDTSDLIQPPVEEEKKYIPYARQQVNKSKLIFNIESHKGKP